MTVYLTLNWTGELQGVAAAT